MSPKGLCMEGLVISLWHSWEIAQPLKGGAYLKKLSHWGHALPLSLPNYHEVNKSHSSHDIMPCQKPKAMWPRNLRLKP
jgi:hypothetical protein